MEGRECLRINLVFCLSETVILFLYPPSLPHAQPLPPPMHNPTSLPHAQPSSTSVHNPFLPLLMHILLPFSPTLSRPLPPLPPSPTLSHLPRPLPPPPPSPSLPHAHCTPQTKKQYEKASEEAENAQHALEKADNDPNSTKAKMDKVLPQSHPSSPISSLIYDPPPSPFIPQC